MIPVAEQLSLAVSRVSLSFTDIFGLKSTFLSGGMAEAREEGAEVRPLMNAG